MIKNILALSVLTFTASFCFAHQDHQKEKIRSGDVSSKVEVTHGVAVGDVTKSSATIWSRANTHSTMFVELKSKHHKKHERVEVSADSDFTGQVTFKGLKADTEYEYSVWFANQKGKGKYQKATGNFSTAPKSRSHKAVRITWSGDFSGQNVCRDKNEGFPIFEAINKEKSDLFIGLGDMIYADNLCEPVGRYGNEQVPGDFIESADLENFWAHWRYNREDESFKELLKHTPYFGLWDDHEVVNDFGPLHDTRDQAPYVAGENLLPIGLKAFFDYTPIAKHRHTPERLYRNVRWGKHAELFFLDNRQYRDANLGIDSSDRPKTMLGREQLTWLKSKLNQSNATWKIIVSSVPISIPTGFPQNLGRDGWTNYDENSDPTIDGNLQSETGFENELISIMKTLEENNSNALFITTDVHFAEVFRYTPFEENPEFKVHEVVIGPGNAGLFPNRAFDTSLGTESLFFYGPESANVESWEEAKKWFNYGLVDISESGELSFHVKDVNGDDQYNLSLMPK